MENIKSRVKKIWPIFWKIVYLVIYLVLLIVIAQFHEHWSDEAQAFLIARDNNNILDLLNAVKYEGTPPLWHIIIKIFMAFGITYNTYFIIPILFTLIGTSILVFKKEIPWYLRVLLPFTYFIFYQYAIVARSYCLIFPCLMIIVNTYSKKEDSPIKFALSLIPFMLISLHTLVISGSLYVLFLMDLYINKKIKERKSIISCIIIFLSLLFTTIITFPASDCYFNLLGNLGNFNYIVAQSTILSNYNIILNFIACCFILILIIFITFRDSDDIYNFLKFAILYMPIVALLILRHCKDWHYGIVFILLIFYFIITNLISKNKLCKILLLICCIVQIYWSANSIYYDYFNKYSASKEVAEYLENNIISQNKTVCGVQYSITAIQGYLSHNIFINLVPIEKGYWCWKIDNSRYSQTTEELINYNADVYVISDYYESDYEDLTKYLEDNHYTVKHFEGYMYIKTHIMEPEGYLVYERAD